MKLRFTRPLKTGLTAAVVLEAVLCVWECALLALVPEAARHYGLYIALLLICVPLGGFAVYAVTWLSSSAEAQEALTEAEENEDKDIVFHVDLSSFFLLLEPVEDDIKI